MHYEGKNGYAQRTQNTDGCLFKYKHFYGPDFLLYEGQIKTFGNTLNWVQFSL